MHRTMSEIKILDGGFSTQLATHVSSKIDGDPLWTARFLSTNPDAIYDTHLDFLRAGADIISTSTYQATIDGFVKYFKCSKEESINLICQGVQCAKKAVKDYIEEIKNDNTICNQKPLIAGSCGPYGAALHDGSEYTGVYGSQVSSRMLIDWHRPRIKALIDSGVDLLALETIPCKKEAEALLDILKEFKNIKAWMSFSCREDGKSIADGTDFQEIVIQCYKTAQPDQLIAIGINCIAPEYVTPLLKGINKSNSTQDFIPLIVYPNSGEKYTVTDGWKKEGQCHSLDHFVHEWIDLGVKYIGGCCRTQATDIKNIRTEVEKWKLKQK